jgi:hypothetical protein
MRQLFRPILVPMILLGLPSIASCGPDGNPLEPAPPLEEIPFDAIGDARILFTRGGLNVKRVYVLDGRTRSAWTVLDTAHGAAIGSSLSPSGSAVAWKRWSGSEWEFDVYVTDLHGANPRRVSSFPGNREGPPAWTPDGRFVVFAVTTEDAGPGAIYGRNLQTDELAVLRAFELDGWDLNCPVIDSNNTPVAAGSDGRLAFSCRGELYVAERQDAPLLPRYEVAWPAVQVHGSAWSPDESELAFIELLEDSGRLTASVRVIELATNAVRTLAVVEGSAGQVWGGTNNHFAVCWLPTGNRVVFNAPGNAPAGATAVTAHLHVVGADGSGLTRLTTLPSAFDHGVSCAR